MHNNVCEDTEWHAKECLYAAARLSLRRLRTLIL